MVCLVLPAPVDRLLARLESAGFVSWVVGGAVRDSLLRRPARDWDIATSARPDQVLHLFPDARPTGLKYGTVTVPTLELPGAVEITTFRSDGLYLDGRHPAAVSFAQDLLTDLGRRDFTINALAYHPKHGLCDPFGGAADLSRHALRTIGQPEERFEEDALRMLRACRFCAELRLRPAKELLRAMRCQAERLSAVSIERCQGELVKLLLAVDPRRGLRLLRVGGLLPRLLPELAATYGLRQSPVHAYSVYYHTLQTISALRSDLPLRLAGLFHDVGKAVTRTQGLDGHPTFPNHSVHSAELCAAALHRLAFPKRLTERVVVLVREHMFYWTPADGSVGLRRLLSRVGPENLAALVALRRADLFSLRPLVSGDHRLAVMAQLEKAVDRILADHPPVRREDLAVTGRDLKETFHLSPGPTVGGLIGRLLEDVLEDPSRNERMTLLQRAALYLDVRD